MERQTRTESAIHSRAMLVRLSVSCWDGRRFDRKVTEEVAKSHGAAREAGRFNKHLLGGRKAAPSHAQACASGAAARVEFYSQTLPWADEGWRLLPTANFERFTDALRKRRVEFEESVRTFLADYPKLRDSARVLLNGMFLESDYPETYVLESKFAMAIEFSPVPATGDFRLDLPADQLATIERDTAERVESATRDAMRAAWDRLRDSVLKARSKLSRSDSIFRDSLIGNIRETAELLSRLNVTQDAGLESMRARVESELAGLDPEALRKNPETRTAAVHAADAILAKMSELYGGSQ